MKVQIHDSNNHSKRLVKAIVIQMHVNKQSFVSKLNKFEQDLLKKFCEKVDKFKYILCPTCNKSFPSIKLNKGECQRCHAEKAFLKKFSIANNMDSGKVPDEL